MLKSHDHLVIAEIKQPGEKLGISRNFPEAPSGRHSETSHLRAEGILVLVSINL